jgi:hypothetical protein
MVVATLTTTGPHGDTVTCDVWVSPTSRDGNKDIVGMGSAQCAGDIADPDQVRLQVCLEAFPYNPSTDQPGHIRIGGLVPLLFRHVKCQTEAVTVVKPAVLLLNRWTGGVEFKTVAVHAGCVPVLQVDSSKPDQPDAAGLPGSPLWGTWATIMGSGKEASVTNLIVPPC